MTPEPPPPQLRTVEAAQELIEWAVASARRQFAAAEAAGDLRLANSLLGTIVGFTREVSKSVGLYSDAPVLSVNVAVQQIRDVARDLTPAEMRERIHAFKAVLAEPETVIPARPASQATSASSGAEDAPEGLETA